VTTCLTLTACFEQAPECQLQAPAQLAGCYADDELAAVLSGRLQVPQVTDMEQVEYARRVISD
jgi:hypothetical protein